MYDSEALDGVFVSPASDGAIDEALVRDRLDAADLSLHRVGAALYVVKPREPGPAAKIIAPDTGAQPMDAVYVTAQRLADAARPLAARQVVVDREALDQLGASTTEEAVFQLPQTLASLTSNNTALFGATAGVNFTDLRGFGSIRTQTLINGRPATQTLGGGGDVIGFDMNAVAEPFLKRIEVETGPAGARRGAPGVAGSLNFVLRTDETGFDAGAQVGVTERGDAEEIALYALGGRAFADGAGVFSAGASLTRIEGLIGADRPETATPFGFALNGLASNDPDAVLTSGFGGSLATPTGAVTGVLLADGDVAPPPGGRLIPQADGSFEFFEGRRDQLYNWSAELSTILPIDRGQAFASARYALSPRVEASALLRAGLSATDSTLAPAPATFFRGGDPQFGDAAVIDLSNPTVPAAIRDAVEAAYGGAAQALVFDHRYAEAGPRRQEIDRLYLDALLELDVDLGAGAALDMYYRYGRSRTRARGLARIDRRRLAIALDPSQCAADTACAPADFFDPAGLSPETLGFIRGPDRTRRLTLNDHEVGLAARKDWDGDGALLGGVRTTIIGRRSRFDDADDAPGAGVLIGVAATTPGGASLTAVDFIGGGEARIAPGRAAIGEIALSTDVRVTASPSHDLAVNTEVGLEWTPAAGVTLFARRHMGARPPTIVELFGVGEVEFWLVDDPCADPGADGSAVVIANCQSDGPLGVGAANVAGFGLGRRAFFGNPDLGNERIRSNVFGAAWRGDGRVGGARLAYEVSAAWLDYNITDLIKAFENPLAACYQSADFSSAACAVNPVSGAAAIQRDPTTRRVVSYDNVLRNGGALDWRGLDLELRLSAEPTSGPVDRVWVSVLHTYTDRFRETALTGETTALQGLAAFPRGRTFAVVGAERGPWDIAAFVTRRGSVETERDGRPETQIPAFVYADVSATRAINRHLELQLNVQNITDRAPPLALDEGVGAVFPQFYDLRGRRYSLSARLQF